MKREPPGQDARALYRIPVADLSKNRFGELPEEVTEFPFLEKLHLYHNAIRIIPETVAMLQSLNYLDLRSVKRRKKVERCGPSGLNF